MGLDDFTTDSSPENTKDKENDLSQNNPPGDAEDWSKHEPGTPKWLSLISGGKVNTDKAESLNNGCEEISAQEILSIRIQKVESTTLRSDIFVKLDNHR